MNGGSREGTQREPYRRTDALEETTTLRIPDDFGEFLGGEDARWGGVSSPLPEYYTIIKTRRASAAIFGSVTFPLIL